MSKFIKAKGGVYIEFTEFTIKLLFLFLPGIIATLVIDVLTSHRKRNIFYFIIYSFVFGTLSYLILNIFIKTNNWIVEKRGYSPTWNSKFLDAVYNSDISLNTNEVLSSSIIGIIVGLFTVYIINHKLVYRIAKKFKISNKHGDGDIWEYVFSSADVEWVVIRDEEGIIYQGSVTAYSEKDEKRELLLSNVRVYNEEEWLYDMFSIYFNFDTSSKIKIEIQKEDNDE